MIRLEGDQAIGFALFMGLVMVACIWRALAEMLDWMRTNGRPPRWYFHLHHTARTALEGGYLRRFCRCGGWRWDRNGWINPDQWPARRWRGARHRAAGQATKPGGGSDV